MSQRLTSLKELPEELWVNVGQTTSLDVFGNCVANKTPDVLTEKLGFWVKYRRDDGTTKGLKESTERRDERDFSRNRFDLANANDPSTNG